MKGRIRKIFVTTQLPRREGTLYKFLLLFLLFCTQAAFSQDVESILDRLPYPDEQKNIIQGILKELDEEGIPPKLVLPKLEEGLAKKIRADLVIKALKKESEHYKTAKAVFHDVDAEFDLRKKTDLWSWTVILLAKGLTGDELKSILGSNKSRIDDFKDATGLLLSLLDWGIEKNDAIPVCILLLKSRITGKEMMGIMDIFITAQKNHIKPEDIIKGLKASIPDAKNLKELKRKILY
ncbi:MAG: hypothetical protein JW969_10865 [Spirochaetales bacterium]|nr:hypothetical protein [Spirochaetales bacterium]